MISGENVSRSTSFSDRPPLLSASTTAIPHIFRLLKAIGPVSKEVSIMIADEGIKFSVYDSSRACQAHVFLRKNLFTSYEYIPVSNEDEQDQLGGNLSVLTDMGYYTSFGVDLKSLINCLQIFCLPEIGQGGGSVQNKKDGYRSSGNEQGYESFTVSSTCRMIYQGEGYPFILLFKENGVITKCEFVTRNDEDDLDAHQIMLDMEKVIQKIIMKGALFHEAMKELTSVNTVDLTIKTQSRKSPHFSLISKGQVQRSVLAFPNEKSVLESFIIVDPKEFELEGEGDESLGAPTSNVAISNTYKFEKVEMARESINLATKVSIRCDIYGVMSIQSMVPVRDGSQSFIDFRFLPLLEDTLESGI